jgi:endonuclease/exonuclease/phosphatase family metal-dependent hydrolase
MSFSVLTLNLWNVSEPRQPRYQALAAGLQRLRPDIICLQEVARDPESGRTQAELVARMCGSPYFIEGNGLAILCVNPLQRCERVALPEFPEDYPREVLFADVVMEGRTLSVADTHLAYRPEMVEERRIQALALLAALDKYTSTCAVSAKVLCGDFNDTAASPAIREVLNGGQHFQDAYAACHSGTDGFTFVSRNKYVDPIWTVDQRIDYVFVSGDLIAERCEIVFDGRHELDPVSDHYGVLCKLSFGCAEVDSQ